MIDLHSHILPGLDDGPADLSDSLALARIAVAAGTGTMVATPHFDHRWSVQAPQIHGGVQALVDALARESVDLRVVTGAEISLTRIEGLSDADLGELRLGPGRHLLIECPHESAAFALEPAIASLRARGFEIVLAHPERCPALQRQPDRLRRLVADGCLCSVTAGSLAGHFGSPVRTFTLQMLREGLAHDVASDAHDHRRRRPGLLLGFAQAEKELPGLEAQIPWLTAGAPGAILAGAPIPPRPELPPTRPLRRWWMRWRRSDR